MGKTSVVNFLPELLGVGTQVVAVNFQGLSGSSVREVPFHAIAARVAADTSRLAPNPQTRWGAVLDWFATLDSELAAKNRRMLIAIDEIERVQDGINAGWCTTDILDFLRASGDRLRAIRLLLVGAQSPERLGREWSDRLISVLLHEISYFDLSTTVELLTSPSADPNQNRLFEALYPTGGIDQIHTQTAGQPYLLQLCLGKLISRLNRQHTLKATLDDIQAALDETVGGARVVFSEIWQDRKPAEQTVLLALLRSSFDSTNHGDILRRLSKEGLVQQHETQWQLRIPLFERWLRMEHED